MKTAVLVGLFYGFWAITWWVEDGITPVFTFSLYTILTSVVLLVPIITLMLTIHSRPQKLNGLSFLGS